MLFNSFFSRIGMHKFFAFLFFVLIFFNQFSVKSFDFEGRTVDFQVVARLSVYVVLFFLTVRSFRRFVGFLVAEHVFLLAFFCYLLFRSVISFDLYSIYSACTNVLVFFLVYALSLRVGGVGVFRIYFWSVVIFSTVSLLFYYYYPIYGRYSYWVDGYFSMSDRMQGIAGHPNTLGFMVGVAIIGFQVLYAGFERKSIALIGLIILLFCLVKTGSKTNFVGVLVFSSFLFALRFRLLLPYLFVACISALLLTLFIEFYPKVFIDFIGSVARSGDVGEVFSFTGRSQIWNFIIERIQQRPVLGWGYGIADKVLIENGDSVGFLVNQVHSLYLQLLFSLGGVGLFLFLFWFVGFVVRCFKLRSYLCACIFLYIALAGFTEAIVFNTIANNAVLVMFCMVLLLSLNDSKSKV